MSKAILILNKMPDYCDEHCKFCDSFFNCQFVGDVEEAYKNRQRDSKCPLKEMPTEMHDFQFDDFENGYNQCLHDILGG